MACIQIVWRFLPPCWKCWLAINYCQAICNRNYVNVEKNPGWGGWEYANGMHRLCVEPVELSFFCLVQVCVGFFTGIAVLHNEDEWVAYGVLRSRECRDMVSNCILQLPLDILKKKEGKRVKFPEFGYHHHHHALKANWSLAGLTFRGQGEQSTTGSN